MMDTGGTLRMRYVNASGTTISLDFGTITAINETFQKRVMTVPLTSLPSDSAFAVESSNSLAYSINYSRVSPTPYNNNSSDSTQWSNSRWYSQMSAAIDRWQAKTDGFVLKYTPDASGDDANPHVPAFESNGYVKNLTRRYKSEQNSVIEGVLTFNVGTMFVNNQSSDLSNSTLPIYKSNFLVTISNSSRNVWYTLMNGNEGDSAVNCISSYTLSGGASSPFEYAILKIPKKRLTAVTSESFVKDIKAGKNQLNINAVGGLSEMIVSKCKLSGDTYTLTAYCKAEMLRGDTLKNGSTSQSPSQWIRSILGGGNSFGINFVEGETYIHGTYPSMGEKDYIRFETGQNIWYILQICAMYLGCKIFFAENKCFVLNYKTDPNSVVESYSMINLYPASLSASDHQLYGRVIGSVSLGDEGIDTVINAQTVYCSNELNKVQTNTSTYFLDSASISAFGGREGSTMYIPELLEGKKDTTSTEGTEGETTEEPEKIQYNQATKFVNNMFSYRREPQQSITFNVKEMHKTNTGNIYWKPCFAVNSRAVSIVDTVDDVTITNASYISGTAPQKFLLSSYERSYPEGISSYTFGVVANIDLSSSTSEILSNLSNVK